MKASTHADIDLHELYERGRQADRLARSPRRALPLPTPTLLGPEEWRQRFLQLAERLANDYDHDDTSLPDALRQCRIETDGERVIICQLDLPNTDDLMSAENAPAKLLNFPLWYHIEDFREEFGDCVFLRETVTGQLIPDPGGVGGEGVSG